MLASVVVDLAQQQPAAIAQARVITTELVSGIDHRPWLGLAPQLVAAKQLGEHRRVRLGRLQIQQGHGGLAGHHQAWLGNRVR
ncbi:hypothetical protein D3C78_1120010 [compost metagenome]